MGTNRLQPYRWNSDKSYSSDSYFEVGYFVM